MAHAPDSNTVRGYLNEQLTPKIIGDLKRRCNRALASQLPVWLAERPKEVAFDLHDAPYYGKDIDLVLGPYHGEPAKDPEEVKRGLARAGTTHFHCYATA